MSKTTDNLGVGDSSTLEGYTWEIPGQIGLTTPNTGIFSSLGIGGYYTFPQAGAANGYVLTSGGVGLPAYWHTAGSATLSSVGLSSSNGFLTFTNSPLTANGVIDLVFAVTGTGNVVLANSPTLVTPVLGAASASSLNVSGVLTSTYNSGAPFVVASNTNVANLNASSLGGATFASPGAIGNGTAGTGVFSSLSIGTQYTFPLAYGTSGNILTSTGLGGTAAWTAVLPLANGGTGVTTGTGSGNNVLSNYAFLFQPIVFNNVNGVVLNSAYISGDYNWNYPSTAGSSGQLLVSGGGVLNPMTWTSTTGTGNVVLATSPTLVTPVLGAAAGTSLSLSGLTASQAVATDGSKNLVSVANTGTGSNVLATSPLFVTGLQINNTGQTQGVILAASGLTSSYSWIYPATSGSSGQFLTSGAGSTLSWTTPTIPTARPMVTYYPNSSQTLSNNSNTIMTFDTKATSLSSGTMGLSFASNTFTCTTAGQYMFIYNAQISAASGTSPVRFSTFVSYTKSGGGGFPQAQCTNWFVTVGTNEFLINGGTCVINMAVNDIASVYAYQNTGGDQTITNNTTNYGVYFQAIQFYP